MGANPKDFAIDQTRASFVKAKIISNFMKISRSTFIVQKSNRCDEPCYQNHSSLNISSKRNIHRPRSCWIPLLRSRRSSKSQRPTNGFCRIVSFVRTFCSCIRHCTFRARARFIVHCQIHFRRQSHADAHVFSSCDSTAGEELANFEFGKLDGLNVPFEKLSCVSTDGAASMIGMTN